MNKRMMAGWMVMGLAACLSHPGYAEEATKAPASAETTNPAQEERVREIIGEIPPERLLALVDKRMKETTERLKLSEEQQEQLRPIVTEQLKKFRELAQGLDGAQRREMLTTVRELRDLRDETESRIDPLLNEAQRAEAEEMRAERQAKAREAFQHWRSGDTEAVRKTLFPELDAEKS